MFVFDCFSRLLDGRHPSGALLGRVRAQKRIRDFSENRRPEIRLFTDSRVVRLSRESTGRLFVHNIFEEAQARQGTDRRDCYGRRANDNRSLGIIHRSTFIDDFFLSFDNHSIVYTQSSVTYSLTR